MSGIADRLTENLSEITATRHEVGHFVAGLDACEGENFSRFAIDVAFTIAFRSAWISNSSGDVVGNGSGARYLCDDKKYKCNCAAELHFQMLSPR